MPYKNKEKQKEYQRLWKREANKKYKVKALNALGGCCVKCLTTDFRVLQIDHVVPIFNQGKRGSELKRILANSKEELKNLQLLCANCHQIKTFEERFKYKNWIK